MKVLSLAVLALLGHVSAVDLVQQESDPLNADIDDGGMDDTMLLEIASTLNSFKSHKKHHHHKKPESQVDDLVNALQSSELDATLEIHDDEEDVSSYDASDRKQLAAFAKEQKANKAKHEALEAAERTRLAAVPPQVRAQQLEDQARKEAHKKKKQQIKVLAEKIAAEEHIDMAVAKKEAKNRINDAEAEAHPKPELTDDQKAALKARKARNHHHHEMKELAQEEELQRREAKRLAEEQAKETSSKAASSAESDDEEDTSAVQMQLEEFAFNNKASALKTAEKADKKVVKKTTKKITKKKGKKKAHGKKKKKTHKKKDKPEHEEKKAAAQVANHEEPKKQEKKEAPASVAQEAPKKEEPAKQHVQKEEPKEVKDIVKELNSEGDDNLIESFITSAKDGNEIENAPSFLNKAIEPPPQEEEN